MQGRYRFLRGSIQYAWFESSRNNE